MNVRKCPNFLLLPGVWMAWYLWFTSFISVFTRDCCSSIVLVHQTFYVTPFRNWIIILFLSPQTPGLSSNHLYTLWLRSTFRSGPLCAAPHEAHPCWFLWKVSEQQKVAWKVKCFFICVCVEKWDNMCMLLVHLLCFIHVVYIHFLWMNSHVHSNLWPMNYLPVFKNL